MNKRIVALMLALLLLLSSCGKKPAPEKPEAELDPPVTEEKKEASSDQKVDEGKTDASADGVKEQEDSAEAVKPDKPSVPDSPADTEKPEPPKDEEKPHRPQDPEKPVIPPKEDGTLTYEEYNAMSGEEQEAYFNSFETTEAFFDWYNEAKQEYQDGKNDIIIDGDTNIDLGELNP